MRVRFLLPARTELKDAVAFYNRKSSGLGFRFSDEVKRATKRILQYPQAYPLISETVRHCQTRGFPYSLIYYSRLQEVVIGDAPSSRTAILD